MNQFVESQISRRILLPLAALTAFSIVIFTVPLTTFSLNVDGESDDNFRHTLSLGRWAHALVKLYILPEPFIQGFTLLVGLIFLSAAALVAGTTLKLNSLPLCAFCTIFVSFPQLSYQLQFLNQADTIGLGYLLAAFSFHLYDRNSLQASKRRLIYLACGLFLLASAFAIYQTFILVALVLILGALVVRSLDRALSPRTLVVSCASAFSYCFLAAALAYLISVVLMQLYSVVPNSYLTEQAISADQIFDQLLRGSARIADFLVGEGTYGLAPYVAGTAAAVALSAIAIKRHRAGAAPIVIVIFLLLLAPFATVYLRADFPPTRTFVAMNVSLAVLIAAMSRRLPYQLGMFVLAVLLTAAQANTSRLFWTDYMVRTRDLQIANNIAVRMQELSPDLSTVPIYFHGGLLEAHPYKQERSETFGFSFFAWDGGSNFRIRNFFYFYDIAEFPMADENQIGMVLAHTQTMPVWPAPGSVQMHEGIMIVRLGEERGYLPFASLAPGAGPAQVPNE